MGFRVVCISATDGAGGEEVAPAVAERLGFRLVDEEVVATAAREAGLDTRHVAEVEQRRSLAIRLLDSLGPSTSMATLAMAGIAAPPSGPDDADLRGLIRSAIEELATRGDAVIVAHAASMALADRDDVLRVMVTAPPEERRRRIAQQRGLDDKEAEKAVARGDANRADYLKRFYRVSSESPADYDLVLSTARLGPSGVTDLIVQAVGARAPAPS